MNFTFKAYENMLSEIKNRGYSFCNYTNYELYESPCILRHDVDFDVGQAENFAHMEYEIAKKMNCKISSTYFVLLNTNFYNIHSTENRNRLLHIMELGHKIGLHFDEKQYATTNDIYDIIPYVQKELDVLSRLIGESVEVVSMHRPSKRFLEANISIPNAINSYSEQFSTKLKYFSDSRMHWREDVDKAITERQHRALHILTHPIWYREDEQSASFIINEFINNSEKKIINNLAENIRDFNELMNSK